MEAHREISILQRVNETARTFALYSATLPNARKLVADRDLSTSWSRAHCVNDTRVRSLSLSLSPCLPLHRITPAVL